MLSAFIPWVFWAAFLLFVALSFWRRKRELDAPGNPCLRFLGPRLSLPVIGVVFLLIGLRNLSDPFHQRHPENFVFEFGFAAAALLVSLPFVAYRVTLEGRSVERRAWPLRPLRYSLDELERIEKRRNFTELLFSGGRRLKLSFMLSGQQAFFAQVQTLTKIENVADGALVRQDAPAKYLAVGIVLAAAAGAIGFAWHLDIADPKDLHQVVGHVEDISHRRGGRTPKTIQILVRDDTRIHRLVLDDPGDTLPAVRTLRIGDTVVAMTKSDLLGRDLERVWVLKRGDEQLLSYTEALRILLTKAERAQRIAFAFGALAAGLLGCAFVLRVRRGAWRAPENR